MKRFVALLVAVIVVVAVWSGGWIYASGLVRQQIEQLATADGETMPRVTCDQVSVGGFPFRFDVDCVGANIVSQDVTLDIAEVRATVLVYAPTHLQVFARSPANFTDAFTGSRRQVDWTDLTASVRTNWFRLVRASLVSNGMVVSDSLAGLTELMRAEHVEAHVAEAIAGRDEARKLMELALYSTVTGFASPEAGLAAGAYTIDGRLSAMPDDIRLWGEPDLLRSLAANEGVLRVVSLEASDTDAVVTGSGEFTLDEGGRIEGSATLTTTGVAERLGSNLAEPWRSLLLGAQGDDGSYVQALTMVDGVLLSGMVPVAVVPPLF